MLSLEFMHKAQKKKTNRTLLGVNVESSQRKGTCRALLGVSELCSLKRRIAGALGLELVHKVKIEEPLEGKT
jgi:hypothetical protein